VKEEGYCRKASKHELKATSNVFHLVHILVGWVVADKN